MLRSDEGQRTVIADKAGHSGVVNAVVAVTKITANGTFTPDADTKAMLVYGCGGGGAGGGAGTTVDSAGGGGNAGGEWLELITSIAPSYTATVGAGGTGVSGGGGNAGNPTTFGPAVNPTRYTANGGSGGVAGSASAAPRATGVNAVGFNPSTVGYQVTGPRSGNSGVNYTATVVNSGRGASSRYGSGGASRITDGVGNAATGHGSGGGGGRSVAAGTSRAGGAGSAGVILIIQLK